MGKLLDGADHPIVFIFLVSIAVACMLSLMSWGAKAAGWPGPAHLFQTP